MRSSSLPKWMPILVAFPSSLCVWITVANGQSYADLVWNQLQSAYAMASEDGYTPDNYIVGKLQEGATNSWTWTFYDADSYLIVGACDGDCADIDLSLENENGVEIASDTAADDVPLLRVTPSVTANYTVNVTMYDCNAEPCYFGIATFFKQR